MTVAAKFKKTLVGLKGAQATMRLYAQQARHEQTRAAFHESLLMLNEVVDDLEVRLQKLEFDEPQYKGL